MIDEGDAGVIGELAEHGGAKSADAEGDAEEHAEIIPKRCGISSCANTMIEDVADERMRQ